MKENFLISDNQIIIHHNRISIIPKIILILLLCICLIMPFIVAFLILKNGDGIHFGIFISMLIFWIPGFFIFRTLLWNIYGKEVIYLKKEEINYIADFKYFKDGKQVMKINGIKPKIVSDEINTNFGKLLITNNSNEEIETVLLIEINKLQRIVDTIKRHYKHIY